MQASAKPTTAPASTKPTAAPASTKPTAALPSEPHAASCAKKTTTTSKGSRLPSVARTYPVTALPAPLPSDYDAKRAAKGKGHEGSDKIRFTSSSDDVVTPIDTKSSGEMMRQGLKFIALVNKVEHELEAEIEDLKKQAQIDWKNQELTDKAKEIVTAEARKSAAALLAEAEKSAIALAAAEEREQYSAAIVKKRDGELSKVVDRLRRADEQIQRLERKFARAKDKFDELQGDPWNNMVYQVERVANLDFISLLLGLVDSHEPPKLEDELTFLTADIAEHARDKDRFVQLTKSFHRLFHFLDSKAPTVVAHDRTLETYAASVGVADPSESHLGGAGSRKATVVSVDGKFSLIGGVMAEVTKSRIEDVAEGAGTVGVPEEMRTDEDSQGLRIDALTEDPRLNDIFGDRPLVVFAHLLALLILMFLDIDFDFAPMRLPYLFPL
ncbi:hypothetical protein AALP_AAs65400U000400 [Arabis alpina]|uniref:Uncharacterized protein n=1 Tax=Arabis alpina TaxID=50452 RepID=A0A087G3S1_ARAAL|nr:hypothetical protein AALP_AAs65400U000400 [Arabis alpina]